MSTLKDKIAYPNIEDYMNIPGSRDTQKWLQAAKEVYYGEKNGGNRNAIIRKVTSGWNINEIFDFVNWLRFYEEGTHLKYKTAQSWYYGNADVGYLLPVKQDPVVTEKQQVSGKDIDFARDSVADEMSVSEKKNIIEKQRQKIIGRLDSAEKLLRSPEGQIFSDKEFSSLLESIYDLKKKVQLVNKRSTSTKLYDDLIIRQANILNNRGFYKASEMLYSLADGNVKEKEEKEATPEAPPSPTVPPPPPPPPPPTMGTGDAGGLPSVGPGAPDIPPVNDAPKTKVQGFLDNLDGNKSDDILEVVDSDDSLLVSEAQEIPTPPEDIKSPITPEKEPKPLPATDKDLATKPTTVPNEKERLEVKEQDAPNATQSKDFDSIMDSVFSTLTIADVVSKFEDIAKFYKTREMPRQLALADMMLDSLGLAPFFPTLSEATNKALEANNYISSRIEDILSKLRGTMKTRELDVDDEKHSKVSPEMEKIKENLKVQEDQDKAKKQMRKDLADKAVEDQMKETPEIEVQEDLEGTPAPEEAKPPTPAPVAPKPTPAI